MIPPHHSIVVRFSSPKRINTCMSCLRTTNTGCGTSSNCVDKFGCPPGVCPDFEIKRHDTKPVLKVEVTDENNDPMDLTDLILEASMWAKAKLKAEIDGTDTSIQLADNIGFEQILVDDIIVPVRVRSPEYMLVTGFDEANKTITVERGHLGTTPDTWIKGTELRIFRFLNSPATTEMVLQDVLQVDGTTEEDVVTASYLIYEWSANDTCVPGCFWLEFKLLKMSDDASAPSVTPVCTSGVGVEWVRRYPACGEYLIKICDSPSAEF